jgi:drug/metabolite transporter (DMT)-like permease
LPSASLREQRLMSHRAAMLLTILAFALYSTMDALAKLLSQRYPLPMIVGGMALFAMLPIAAATLYTGGPRVLKTRRPAMHAIRTVLVCSNVTCSFFAYRYLPLSDAYAVAFSAPLFLTLAGALFLGETVGWRRWSAVAVGFAGVLIALRPGPGMFSAGALAMLGAAVGYSISTVMTRHLRRTETREATMFYGMSGPIVMGAIWSAFVWVPLQLADLPLLAACGLLNGLGQLCFITALRNAPAGLLAPFQYTQMLWGVLFGFALFGNLPDAPVLLGGAIVICSGLYILHRETVRGRVLAQENAPL